LKIVYILIETRLELIKLACDNHLPNLPDNDLVIYTYPEHFKEIQIQLKDYSNRLILEEITDRPFHVHNVNLIFTSKVFWERYLDYDRVLIFQSDSEILKPGLEEFLEYDYIGAPWKDYDSDYFPYVGNGGLSIRNPKVMLEVLAIDRWGRNMGEDLFICRSMVNNDIGRLAPYELAKKFSVESIFELGTFGAHAIDKWFSKEKCEQIRTQYDNL